MRFPRLTAEHAELAEKTINHEDAKETKDTKKSERATGPLAGRDGANGAATQTATIERL